MYICIYVYIQGIFPSLHSLHLHLVSFTRWPLFTPGAQRPTRVHTRTLPSSHLGPVHAISCSQPCPHLLVHRWPSAPAQGAGVGHGRGLRCRHPARGHSAGARRGRDATGGGGGRRDTPERARRAAGQLVSSGAEVSARHCIQYRCRYLSCDVCAWYL